MATSSAIDTRHVAGRRKLRFARIEDALAECERLAAADRAGKARCLGNWTLGQIFGHLAVWVEFAYRDIPLQIPFWLRWMGPLMKRRVVHHAMPAGSNIPGVPRGTLGKKQFTVEAGLERYRQALTRLQSEPPAKPHPLFGRMTHDQWIGLHLRHAELHLSFVTVCGDGDGS